MPTFTFNQGTPKIFTEDELKFLMELLTLEQSKHALNKNQTMIDKCQAIKEKFKMYY